MQTKTAQLPKSAKIMQTPQGVELSEAIFTFSQAADSCDDGSGQTIEVTLTDAGAGKYLLIKSERWAVDADEIELFTKMLKSCFKLVEPEKEKKT